MKRCSRCHEIKAESDFYKDKRTKDGLKCQCKKCHCETAIRTRDEDKHRIGNKLYMRRMSSENPQKARAYWRTRKETDSLKKKAREILNAAVRSGKIKRPTLCQQCGSAGMVYAHHEDYNKPLSVEWLCSECHGIRHRKMGLGDRV